MRLPLWLVIGAIAAPIFIVVGFFALHFAHTPISSEPEDWARFGEYVGGSLGAVYGFLALLGVLLTLTSEQTRSHIEEVQRLMSVVAARIDEIFGSEMAGPGIDPAIREQRRARGEGPFSVFGALSALGVVAMDLPAPRPNREEILKRGKESFRDVGPLLSIELQELVALSQDHARLGGSEVIRGVYLRKYRIQVAWMQIAGVLSSDIVRDYFDAANAAEQIRRQSVQQTVPSTASSESNTL